VAAGAAISQARMRPAMVYNGFHNIPPNTLYTQAITTYETLAQLGRFPIVLAFNPVSPLIGKADLTREEGLSLVSANQAHLHLPDFP